MIAFRTKAQTLEALEPLVKKSRILPQIRFTVDEYRAARAQTIKRMEQFADGGSVIVRSSALCEDSASESKAGQFLSVADVRGAQALGEAADRVADSFTDGDGRNMIFVQPMLKDICLSGVVFTADPNTLGNYYVINYDDSTGSTSSVTSGAGDALQTYYLFHKAACGVSKLCPVIEAVRELESLFVSTPLDVEFAVDGNGTVYILQVRPLVLRSAPADLGQQAETLGRIYQKVESGQRVKPYLHGKRTIYGVMPDWNPAEIIGVRPRPLALSLYKRLVTDGVWAYQRNNYGYKNLRSFPLMIDFAGFPYIDTRVSFNSFIPRDIDDHLSEKLADYYLDCLERQPYKHDKVEFDIIFSCYTFDLPERIQTLRAYGFSDAELETVKASLLALTNNIINTKDGLWISDTERINVLEQRRENILKSDLDTVSKIYWLIEDCCRYGTLPFAGLARGGFIAVLLLKSLVNIGLLSDEDYQRYMNGLTTVSSQMIADRRNLSKEAFLVKYGHLRPGTYDILSSRYDETPDLYFSGEDVRWQEIVKQDSLPFSLTLEQYRAIQDAMTQHGLKGDLLALFQFIRAGIEGREYSKYVFTKSLSAVIELAARLGAEYGYSREDMSYLDISVIDTLYSSAEDIGRTLGESIRAGREKYARTLGITLPPVICRPQDVYAFFLPTGQPNYITLKSVSGQVCGGRFAGEQIAGKILLIEAADPGYDWIFSHEIAGFVTAYGGANSHLAIRAGELGIPAVIGVGEKLFARYSAAHVLELDCANKQVKILQ